MEACRVSCHDAVSLLSLCSHRVLLLDVERKGNPIPVGVCPRSQALCPNKRLKREGPQKKNTPETAGPRAGEGIQGQNLIRSAHRVARIRPPASATPPHAILRAPGPDGTAQSPSHRLPLPPRQATIHGSDNFYTGDRRRPASNVGCEHSHTDVEVLACFSNIPLSSKALKRRSRGLSRLGLTDYFMHQTRWPIRHHRSCVRSELCPFLTSLVALGLQVFITEHHRVQKQESYYDTNISDYYVRFIHLSTDQPKNRNTQFQVPPTSPIVCICSEVSE